MNASREVLVAESLACALPSRGSGMAPLRDASLRVARGEVVAVLGPSGSGKSTLLALCGGLEWPDRGRVLVNGMDVARLDDGDRESFLQQVVGWVLQSPGLVPLLTAEENVALAIQLAHAIRQDKMSLAVSDDPVDLEMPLSLLELRCIVSGKCARGGSRSQRHG